MNRLTNDFLDTDRYAEKTVEEVTEFFETNPERGLSSIEADKRLAIYGRNEIPEKEEGFVKRFLKRFYGPIPFMIEFAALLSALVKKWDDFFIIIALLFFNAIIDVAQESKALNALKVLKKKLAKKAIVLRDGRFKEINAVFLVPGDVIKIRIGDVVPADIKLIKAEELELDQSALTGESLPFRKNKGDVVYGDSIVKKGEGLGIVVNTGMSSYFGKTASLVAKAERISKSHLQQAVVEFGKYLISISVLLSSIIFFVALFRHENFIEILRFVLVLTVASIPVALPAVLSVTLAVGALKLSRKKAIVSRLAAIEELAGADTLCFDKTGTLTQNKMSVSKIALFDRFSEKELMVYAALASNEEENDPIEQPIFDYLKKNSFYDELKKYKRIKFKPFNPVDKRTEVIVQKGNRKIRIVKGAVHVVLAMSQTRFRKKIEEKIEELSSEGMRTLGVAVGSGDNLRFVGLIPLLDPPREDSKEVIEEARKLGLDLKMITGDNLAIARYIASQVGIGSKIINAHTMRAEAQRDKTKLWKEKADYNQASLTLHESDIIKSIEEANGFAQVYPEDKYFIVEKLQEANHIVGMTGDGVNDSPALKKADAGIAVSGATDAARAAADVILLNPGLSVIIDAIKEARKIFERMKSYSTYRIAETIRLIFFITASVVFLGFYPISPIMVILLLILNDLPILAIAYDNTRIDKKPVRWNLKEVLAIATALGISGVIASFGVLYLAKEVFKLSMPMIQTIVFLKLAIAGHSTIYVARTNKRFWKKPYPAPILLLAGLGTEILATLFAVYGWFVSPIGWTYALFIWGYAFLWLMINDQVKIWVYQLLGNKNL